MMEFQVTYYVLCNAKLIHIGVKEPLYKHSLYMEKPTGNALSGNEAD